MMQNKCNELTCLSLSTGGKSNTVFLEKSNVLTKKKYSNNFKSLICYALDNRQRCMNVKLPRILSRMWQTLACPLLDINQSVVWESS